MLLSKFVLRVYTDRLSQYSVISYYSLFSLTLYKASHMTAYCVTRFTSMSKVVGMGTRVVEEVICI